MTINFTEGAFGFFSVINVRPAARDLFMAYAK